MVRGSDRFFSLTLIICVVLALFSGCSEKEDTFKEDMLKENDESIFRQILNSRAPEEVKIQSIDVYEHEGYYYYHVKYSFLSSFTNEWKDRDLVYFGMYLLDNFFSLTWTEWGDMEKYRDAYYEAVEKGEHRAFSAEKIQQGVDAFYSSKQSLK